MFKEHGSFEELEIQVKKKLLKSREKLKSGGWYTKHALEFKEGWSKSDPQFHCWCLFNISKHTCRKTGFL